MLTIRAAAPVDFDSIWNILEPTIRAGDTYTLDSGMSREAALAYWCSERHDVFVAEEDGHVAGTYYLRANQGGGGSHVANCGYMTAVAASGRGVARAVMLRAMPPKTTAWKGLTLHQYRCPARPRGWNRARCR